MSIDRVEFSRNFIHMKWNRHCANRQRNRLKFVDFVTDDLVNRLSVKNKFRFIELSSFFKGERDYEEIKLQSYNI